MTALKFSPETTFKPSPDLGARLLQISNRIGNTPVISLTNLRNTYAKIESYQLGGSIKIRPAYYMIKMAIASGQISSETTVIESTSGNFGIALAIICRHLGIKFIAVIDKNTPNPKEQLLKIYGADVVRICEKDETGSYLLNRIRYIENFKKENPGCYHPNQYENEHNPESYYVGLGEEISSGFDTLDAVFIAVSSGGTVTGLSQKLKEKFQSLKIIAVDVEGSLIFSKEAKPRSLSGIGSSISPTHLQNACIDKVVILSENEILQGWNELIKDEVVLCGTSSGAVYAAAKEYQKQHPDDKILLIFPDCGSSYIENIIGI